MPTRRQSNQFGTAVIRIWHALDVAMLCQVRHQFSHRLHGDVGVSSQIRDAGAAIVVDVFEDRKMRRANGWMAV